MNVYDRETVFKETLKYFNGDELSTNVWINKYALKDSDTSSTAENGDLKIYELTPDDMHRRISK